MRLNRVSQEPLGKGGSVRKPSYANVASTLALLVALSGAAYAAALAPNSVGTKHLKDKAVSRAKIKDNAVNSAKIAPGGVGASDIGGQQVGFDHLSFTPYDMNNLRVGGNIEVLAPNDNGQSFAHCDAGWYVVGGGWTVNNYDVKIGGSFAEDHNTWVVDGYYPGAQTNPAVTIQARAVCVPE